MDYDTFKKAAIRGQDEIVQCPYNPSHLIAKSRMQYHLVKCSKQHPLKEYKTCPFNATHRVAEPELSLHISNCEDRRILETAKYQVQSTEPKSEVKSRKYEVPPIPPSEENWDDDDLLSSYEPEKHVSNKMVFRNLQGATKSERKQFRMEERRRVNQLTDKTEVTVEPVKVDSPLRPPKSLPIGMKPLEIDSRLGMGRGLASSSSTDSSGSWQVVGNARGRGAIPRK